MTNVDDLLHPSKEPRHYNLKILQQPRVARMSSFKEKRPVDPPAIVELEVLDRSGRLDDE